MLLSELLGYCNRNLGIATNSFYDGAHQIAAEQLGELSALVQNELQDATTPSGARAIPPTATSRHETDAEQQGRTEPVEQSEEKTETQNTSDSADESARDIRNRS